MFKALRDWSSEFVTPFQEALKEAVRDTLFSIPGQLILFIDDRSLTPTAILLNVLAIFLRSLDKFLYERSKNRGQKLGEVIAGLSPI